MTSPHYILDTDSITYHQMGHTIFLQRLSRKSPDTIATTVVSLYEQLRGRLAAINRQQDDHDLQLALKRLQQTHAYFCRVLVVQFEAEGVAWYRQLRQQKLQIGTQDLRIAAITLSHRAILVTSNRRHFDLVPGLMIEDWSLPD